MMGEDAERTRIALRIIVDGSDEIARNVWLKVCDVVEPLASSAAPIVRPYWKFSGTQEIATTLVPLNDADAAFDELVRRMGSGWAEIVDDEFSRWTIWNAGSGSFVAPSVRWAHAELIRVR
jgi:hypothetical protein